MIKTLKIEGMSCMHCAGTVKKALSAINGVDDVKVDLEKKTAIVDASGTVADDVFYNTVKNAGFELIEIA